MSCVSLATGLEHARGLDEERRRVREVVRGDATRDHIETRIIKGQR